MGERWQLEVNEGSDYGLARNDRELLIGMKADLKYIRKKVEENERDMEAVIKDHEDRIRLLEHFRWWIVGAVAASAGLAALIERILR